MEFKDIIIIGIALAMDASAIALSIGINCSVKRENKLIFGLSFGFFQFFLAFLGAIFGVLFNTYITSIPQVIGGGIIAFVGVMMIKEGFEEKDKCILVKPRMYLILGISVSIDALVVGFTAFNNVNNYYSILKGTLIIGLITLILSYGAFYLSKYARKILFITQYADYIGGAMLILFGIKMMFS
ncbi:manganese efflux pump MntP family protein [Clostridium fallax]|uniref:Putative manganese efflux pump MntP n=1 Tax=Clostridium fallax TaxID=1533 RepID=A0A1M4VTQ3_9CLOT|nr:manganese efflux pump [Clostridium fallax]SHE72328.1 Putative Mn2+ efflux pump MntP [Clostridium fallax]SQB07687.1 membrane protein [Clostridium fallax]